MVGLLRAQLISWLMAGAIALNGVRIHNEQQTTTTETTHVSILEPIPATSTTTTTQVEVSTRRRWTASTFEGLRPAPDWYWDKVAQCETAGDWQNPGRWSGGLGIYVDTWRGYGGLQFAPSPPQASREEQIVIANRISMFGFQTRNLFMTWEDRENNRPFFRPPVGFNGWGCIKNNKRLTPPVPGPWEQL